MFSQFKDVFVRVISITLIGITLMACSNTNDQMDQLNTIVSPNKKLSVGFDLDEQGQFYYYLLNNQDTVIRKSSIGFTLVDKELKNGFEITEVKQSSGTDEYELPWGEVQKITAAHADKTISLKHNSGVSLNVFFKLYDDGLGFRYGFPKKAGLDSLKILEEHSQFNFTEDPDIWWGPGDWNSYENNLYHTKLSEVNATQYNQTGENELIWRVIPNNAVMTPATLKFSNKSNIAIHEANLTNYPGMTLGVKNNALESILTGSKLRKEKAIVALPFKTPWRTILVEDKAIDLLNNHLVLNLNEPNVLGDVSWFQPKKYVGIWWEMFLGKGTWDFASRTNAGNQDNDDRLNGKVEKSLHAANTANAKKYIDFAHENGITGILIEGWNTGWEEWTNEQKRDTVFDFVTPYPDFDLKEVAQYGLDRNVEFIVHHETSAATPQYEKQMDTAFAQMQSLGLHSIKSGYVGNIVPRGEYHHGQYMVNHYRKVIETAAKYEVAVNTHEPIKQTGLRRTYPNIISCEGAKGQEYNAFCDYTCVNQVSHVPTLIYTRCLAGPFDYTPGIFNLEMSPWKPEDDEVLSTIAQQLGLYVCIYSPISMAADLPEHYQGQPAFQFIREVGFDWAQTVPVLGEIGEYAVIARQERKTGNWFVGGVNGEKDTTIDLEFSFLEEGKTYTANIYKDAADTHYRTNKTAIDISSIEVTKDSKISIEMKIAGGFGISIFEKK